MQYFNSYIATGHKDDSTIGCLVDCNSFNKHYEMVPIYLSEQQALNADPRAIQQIDSTRNLDRAERATIFFFIEKAKEKF